MKKNNTGFSLVELVVAFALLSIVSVILISFMVSGSNMYKNVSTEFALQMQSQTAMAQIKEYVVDCNGAVYFDGETLTVRNTDKDHCFVWDSFEKTVTYNGDLLATDVSSFIVNAPNKAVLISAVFEKNGKTYESTHAIALRNETVSLSLTDAPPRG